MAFGSVPAAIGGVYVLDALERAHGEQFDQLLLTLLAAALLLCGGATLARSLFLKQLEQKERDSVAPTARNKGAAVVLIGSGLGLLAKGGAGVPAAALAAFPLAAAGLVVARWCEAAAAPPRLLDVAGDSARLVGMPAGYPPGPRYPRALATLGWALRPASFMERCRDRYGDTFTLKIAQEGTWVFLSDPEDVKQVFTGDPRLLHAGAANVVLLPLLGPNSVLLLDEGPHMAQRKLMLPPFHGDRMRGYREVMAAVTERQLDSWPLGEPFELWPHMQAVTLEVIMRTVFGVREGERLERLRRALRELLEWTSDRRRLVFIGLAGPERALRMTAFAKVRRHADELLYDEIRERRAVPDLAERDDVLSMLVQATHEDGRPMGDEELRDELMTLLVAGHETTATALAWAIERLVRHPEKLERLGSGDDDYVDAVVKETLRLRPILPVVLRRLAGPMEIGGRVLPEGAIAAPCVYLVHRRADVYPEPERFRPERFLEQPAGTYTWIPFGGGVRRCLGASFALFEMKVVLETIASRLWLRPARPEPEPISRRAITLTPGRGSRVVASAAGGAPRRDGLEWREASPVS